MRNYGVTKDVVCRL